MTRSLTQDVAPWIVALLAGAATALACGGKAPELPNVVLISIDTLRADHVGVYGYGKGTTPHIDRLGRQGIVFERAYSSASHTLPAHASLLTGVEPSRHGLLTADDGLPGEIPTLAARLRAAGYRTGAFVNAGYLHEKFGLARGFDVYDFAHNQRPRADSEEPAFGRDAAETNRAIVEWLDEPDERPVFLFAHYYDVHSDWGRLAYEAPPAERARFETPRPDSARLDPGKASASVHLQRLNRGRVALDERERAWLRSLYDAGIAYTDARVGDLLAALEERGIFDRSIVILTSDHGEEFQEHGLLLHEQVYEELVRVPLIVRFPASDRVSPTRAELSEPLRVGRRIAQLVRHVDIVPTLLDLAGLLEPARPLAGRSLGAVLRGDADTPRVAVARNQSGNQVAVTDGRFKLVTHRAGQTSMLFDLSTDPHESLDIAAAHPGAVARLRELRREQLSAARPAPEPSRPLDPEVLDALRALGYTDTGGGAALEDDAGSPPR